MPATLTAPHTIFVLPDERSRSYLRSAKWLAHAEGIILLVGSFMILSRTGVAHVNQLAMGAAVLAILSITLGSQVGRGSARAGMMLLGLSISRGVMTFVPNAPDWWTTFPPLTVLELFVFGNGVRAAIALSQSKTALVARSPIAATTNQTVPRIPEPRPQTKAPIAPRPFRFIDPVPEPLADTIWPRSFFVDCIVVAVIGVYAFFAMNTDIPSGEGLMGVWETLLVLFGFFNSVLAVVLLVSATGARKGKRWAERVRAGVYWVLLGQVLLWLSIKI